MAWPTASLFHGAILLFYVNDSGKHYFVSFFPNIISFLNVFSSNYYTKAQLYCNDLM